jgi:hypothetical protein
MLKVYYHALCWKTSKESDSVRVPNCGLFASSAVGSPVVFSAMKIEGSNSSKAAYNNKI